MARNRANDQGNILNPGVVGPGTYDYRISAVDAYNHSTQWSNIESGTIGDGTAGATPGLVVNGTSITVTWPAADGYNAVLYSVDGGSYVIGNGNALPYVPGGQLNTTNGTITATLTNLTPGTQYDFTLWTPVTETSDDELQQYTFGNTSATTAGTAPLSAPNAPSNAVANWGVPNEAGVFLHWVDNSNNETGFWVYRSEGGTAFNASSAVPVASLGADTTTFDDPNADATQTSFYDVFGYDGPAGPAPTAPPAPTGTAPPPVGKAASQPAAAAAPSLKITVTAVDAAAVVPDKLKPEIAKLYQQLGDEDFGVRDAAQKKLEAMALQYDILPLLTGADNPEAESRAAVIIKIARELGDEALSNQLSTLSVDKVADNGNDTVTVSFTVRGLAGKTDRTAFLENIDNPTVYKTDWDTPPTPNQKSIAAKSNSCPSLIVTGLKPGKAKLKISVGHLVNVGVPDKDPLYLYITVNK